MAARPGNERRRGRPPGNPPRLNAVEKRGRNAQYERERRCEEAESLNSLRESVGLSIKVTKRKIVTSGIVFIAKHKRKEPLQDIRRNIQEKLKEYAEILTILGKKPDDSESDDDDDDDDVASSRQEKRRRLDEKWMDNKTIYKTHEGKIMATNDVGSSSQEESGDEEEYSVGDDKLHSDKSKVNGALVNFISSAKAKTFEDYGTKNTVKYYPEREYLNSPNNDTYSQYQLSEYQEKNKIVSSTDIQYLSNLEENNSSNTIKDSDMLVDITDVYGAENINVEGNNSENCVPNTLGYSGWENLNLPSAELQNNVIYSQLKQQSEYLSANNIALDGPDTLDEGTTDYSKIYMTENIETEVNCDSELLNYEWSDVEAMDDFSNIAKPHNNIVNSKSVENYKTKPITDYPLEWRNLHSTSVLLENSAPKDNYESNNDDAMNEFTNFTAVDNYNVHIENVDEYQTGNTMYGSEWQNINSSTALLQNNDLCSQLLESQHDNFNYFDINEYAF